MTKSTKLAFAVGVETQDLDERDRKQFPSYIPMGAGLAVMMPVGQPANMLPMGRIEGPFGEIAAGAMVPVFKVRQGIESYENSGTFKFPEGTVAGTIVGVK